MQKHEFFDEVHDYQRFVRENIKVLGNYTIISEQLIMRGNEIGIVDMLVVDNNEKRLTILELKNTLTTDKNAWQPLRYYDLAKRGEDDLKTIIYKASSLLKYDVNEIDLNPKLVLVVPECNQQLLRTLSYFDDIDSCVIEFNRYDNGKYYEIRKSTYYPTTIFHKEDLVEVSDKISKVWNFIEYHKVGINSEKLKLAESIISQLRFIFSGKGYKFDVFFNETKITITKDDKVWGHIFIKQKPLDYCLVLSFKMCENNKYNFSNVYYNPVVKSHVLQKNKIKLTINGLLSTDSLKELI